MKNFHSEEYIKVISARLGIVIHHHQFDTFKKVINEACKKFHCTPDKYLDLLKTADENSEILEHLVAGITIGETYFFRDKKQMELLRATVLPRLIERKMKSNEYSLRIWSAGCSSGEEIYTVGMMLTELLPDLSRWHLALLGTDINTNQLKKAVSATYSDWSMRAIPSEMIDKYFIKNNKAYILRSAIKDLVNFEYLNLKSDVYPSMLNNTNSQDLIICRNVIIYFDKVTSQTIVDKFSYCLVEDGFLLLGASDPIESTNKSLVIDQSYRMLFSKQTVPVVKTDYRVPVREKINSTKAVAKLPKKGTGIKKPIEKKITKSEVKVSSDEMTELENQGQWEKILTMINAQEKSTLTPKLAYKKGVSLANLGKLEEAVTQFKECLTQDKFNRSAYLSLAMTLMELGKLKEAEQELRKILFLDHNDVLGHFQLGLLLLKMKRKNEGVLSLKNALKISKIKNQSELIGESSDLSYGRLVEILEKDIAVYSMES